MAVGEKVHKALAIDNAPLNTAVLAAIVVAKAQAVEQRRFNAPFALDNGCAVPHIYGFPGQRVILVDAGYFNVVARGSLPGRCAGVAVPLSAAVDAVLFAPVVAEQDGDRLGYSPQPGSEHVAL